VRIQDQSISPQSGNVILVDEVDGAAGPRIVETMRVEPRFPGGFVDIDTVVRRHPALLPFLRCDARFPDQPQHSPIEIAMWRHMTDLTCARLPRRPLNVATAGSPHDSCSHWYACNEHDPVLNASNHTLVR
jgi:hypothetical protein